MKKILLTAFEPFGGESINPALEIARILETRTLDVEIRTVTVPVTFRDAARTVLDTLNREAFDAIVMLGQAGGRSAVTPERIAINIDDARIPDNIGDQPVDRPIVPGGPAAIFATLPIKAMVTAMQEAGISAAVSNSAGTFVCNHLMYRVLHHLDGSGVPAGFVHVPYLPEQVADKPNTPSMSLSDMIKGIEAALLAL